MFSWTKDPQGYLQYPLQTDDHAHIRLDMPPRAKRTLLRANPTMTFQDTYFDIYFDRRKFRSQTSDNMDRWKSRGGKSQRRRIVKIGKERVRIFFSSHIRAHSGSIQPECQKASSNIWRRYQWYVELGQVNMQEIVDFEQSCQNVEGRFPRQSDMFLLSRIHSPGLDREHWRREANTLSGNMNFFCRWC